MLSHKLSFKVDDFDGQGKGFEPLIDGMPLSDLVESYEVSQGYNDPAGGYGRIVQEYARLGPLDVYYQGHRDAKMADLPEFHYFLGCDCTVLDCWPLIGRISLSEVGYEWSGFSNPHRPKRNYSELGSFRFEHKAYEAVIAELESQF
jgi:hypothetical protein